MLAFACSSRARVGLSAGVGCCRWPRWRGARTRAAAPCSACSSRPRSRARGASFRTSEFPAHPRELPCVSLVRVATSPHTEPSAWCCRFTLRWSDSRSPSSRRRRYPKSRCYAFTFEQSAAGEACIRMLAVPFQRDGEEEYVPPARTARPAAPPPEPGTMQQRAVRPRPPPWVHSLHRGVLGVASGEQAVSCAVESPPSPHTLC